MTDMTDFTVRLESPDDASGIYEVNRLAFGRRDEAELVLALSKYAVVSVVATSEGEDPIIGHALFSELSVESGDLTMKSLALAPVAVLPKFQKRGVGTKMVRRGLELCREAGYELVLVLGDTAYYERFGFSVELASKLDSPYSGEHFMALRLVEGRTDTSPIRGKVRYPPPFG